MYVLDTDVFSITSPASNFHADTVNHWRVWVRDNEHQLFLSVVTIMEVRFGIEKLVHRGNLQKARLLSQWLGAVETSFKGHLIPITAEIASRAGEMLYTAVRNGFMPSSEDAYIAASANIHDFTVLSRNAKDMKALEANWMDPLEGMI